MLKLEMRGVKNEAEADFRRRIFTAGGKDGGSETVTFGWACQCGRPVEPDAAVLVCVGCGGLHLGKLSLQAVRDHEQGLRGGALAWT